MAKEKDIIEKGINKEEVAKAAGNFSSKRINDIRKLYADEVATARSQDKTPTYQGNALSTAAEVYEELSNAIGKTDSIIELSKKLYATNPIYMSVVDYMANISLWRYTVVPQRVYTKSKAKIRKGIKNDEYELIYNLMMEAVDGISIETKFPLMLTNLFMTGSVFYTTYCDEDSIAIDTIALPSKYCRRIAESQFGTSIIQFDFSYFKTLGMTDEKLKEYFKSFPKEFETGYRKYLKDSSKMRWQTLDPRFSSGMMLNEMGIPTFFYLYAGILNYEKYQNNELERSNNLLKYLVVQTMPHYEDKLIFEVDEVNELHRSMKRIVDTSDKARLVTTFGDIHVERIGETNSAENDALIKAFKAIFNNAGFNNSIYTSESVEALKMSIIKDRTLVWKYIKQLSNFYTLAVNNWYDFKGLQADIDILQISAYTYNDDMKTYKESATLGVNKLGYFVASGIKQRNIQDQLNLEKFLKLDSIVPMQTSYTQTAEDRVEDGKDEDTNNSKNNTNKNARTDDSNKESSKAIEPAKDEEV